MNQAQLQGMRNLAATKQVGYSHDLRFTRRFTSGTLVGMTHEDHIPFCSMLDAEEGVSSVNQANAKGKLNYRVETWKVVSL